MAFDMTRIEKLGVVFAILVALLFGRLVYLQGFIGKELAALGLLSRVHELKLESARGTVFDRNMQPLTNRTQQYRLTIFPSQFNDKKRTAELLAGVLPRYAETVTERIAEAIRPEQIARSLTKAEAEAVESLALSGVIIDRETERYGPFASHVIGYANQADNHGISGIEAAYDNALKFGESSYLAALLDAKAALIPGLSYKKIRLPAAKEPKAVVLTIDAAIQKTAEDVFDRYADKGAVVVMDPSSGDVLAMVSRPNFNAENLARYLNQKDSPLLNRAINAYQPGSVFKMAVAAAALEKHLVTPEETFLDQGYIDVDGTVFRGWDYKRGAHTINFTEAMAYSSNPVFIEVGLRVGMKELVRFAQTLGFGAKSGLPLQEEKPGHLPDAENIYRGENANLSIGQGECEATPLQIAGLVAAVVNQGVQMKPVLVDRVIDEDGSVLQKREAAEGKRVFSKRTAAAIREMMTAVNRYGTGQAAYVEHGGSAGKTGSAETGRVGRDGKGISHAWYAGYAPLKDPGYVVVVFVEDGMSGGDVAAPIFREIVERMVK